MELNPIDASRDALLLGGWTVSLVPSDPSGRFRLVDSDGQVRGDPAYEGTEIRIRGIPYFAHAQFPYQPNNNLLDAHLPPHPERPNIRTTGNYVLRLALLTGGSVTTSGYFEEFVPWNS